MRFPMTVLRVVTLAPALLVSFVLTVVVCALLTPALGLVAFLAAGGLLVALALGRFEPQAIAALDRDALSGLLAYASAAAAITVTRRGADLPTAAEVEAALR